MFEKLTKIFKKFSKDSNKDSKDTAKERLHLVLMQDRANVSADFLELMKQEIIEVIKKYIDVDENSIDVKLTNKVNSDGTTGAPALYANIPIISLKDDAKNLESTQKEKDVVQDEQEENVEVEAKDEDEEVEVEEETEKDEDVENSAISDEGQEEQETEEENNESEGNDSDEE